MGTASLWMSDTRRARVAARGYNFHSSSVLQGPGSARAVPGKCLFDLAPRILQHRWRLALRQRGAREVQGRQRRKRQRSDQLFMQRPVD